MFTAATIRLLIGGVVAATFGAIVKKPSLNSVSWAPFCRAGAYSMRRALRDSMGFTQG